MTTVFCKNGLNLNTKTFEDLLMQVYEEITNHFYKLQHYVLMVTLNPNLETEKPPTVYDQEIEEMLRDQNNLNDLNLVANIVINCPIKILILFSLLKDNRELSCKIAGIIEEQISEEFREMWMRNANITKEQAYDLEDLLDVLSTEENDNEYKLDIITDRLVEIPTVYNYFNNNKICPHCLIKKYANLKFSYCLSNPRFSPKKMFARVKNLKFRERKDWVNSVETLHDYNIFKLAFSQGLLRKNNKNELYKSSRCL